MATIAKPLPRAIEQLRQIRELADSGEARRLRIAARLSQGEIAAHCDTTPSAVSRWENGERVPRGRPARRYAAIILGLSEAAREDEGGP
jgi:transcriptional regulator with XRE-family HTH domain